MSLAQRTLYSYRNRHVTKAIQIINLYLEGSDLDEEQEHLLNDTALEHGQILDNVIGAAWFVDAVAENIEVLEDTP